MNKIWFEQTMLAGYDNHLIDFECLGAEGVQKDTPLADIADANAIIAGSLEYNAELMDQAPQLKVIARKGIGVNSVDIAAATERNIAVVNAPDAPTVPTIEQSMMLLLATAKNLKQSHTRLRAGEKNLYARHTSMELNGKTLGLVGFGRIAKGVARASQALGMTVLSFDPFVSQDLAKEHNVKMCSSLEELLASADVVSIHPPLNDGTYQFMKQTTFALMKQGSIFINAGRGGLVDEAALIAALESGHLFGAGLDVTDPEPPSIDNPLLAMDNVIITPHIASATPEGKRRNFEGALFQAIQVLKGEKPPHLVNPEVWTDSRFNV